MILPPYSVKESVINMAGKGIFFDRDIKKGSIVVYPDKIERVYTAKEIEDFGPDSLNYKSSVRWFEDYYSFSPEWSEECYINHSFDPNGLWHLGFIFALRDIKAGEELTIDYSFLAAEGQKLGFTDSATGREIIGMPWKEHMARACRILGSIME